MVGGVAAVAVMAVDNRSILGVDDDAATIWWIAREGPRMEGRKEGYQGRKEGRIPRNGRSRSFIPQTNAIKNGRKEGRNERKEY